MRLLILSAMLALGTAAIAGCGASNTLDPVARAATISNAAPGFRMTMNVRESIPMLAQPLTITGAGSFDARDRAGSLAMSIPLSSLAGQPGVAQALGKGPLTIDVVFDHLTIYIRLPAAMASRIPGGKPWLELNLVKLGAAAGLPGISALANNPAAGNPSQMLSYLRAESGSITKLGTEQVDGVQTVHYRATIDLDKVAGTVPSSSRAAVQQTVATLKQLLGSSSLPVDVWVDGASLVRRMRMVLNEHPPGVPVVHVAMQLGFSFYGPQPRPTLPPPSQVTDLGSLVGQTAP